MKPSESESKEVTTPPAKKLKQARLPFKLISDVSPKPTSPQTRKRKLSITEVESVTKVGKISKENGLNKDLIVISDDDSKDGLKLQNEDKPHNPLVKLVDTAMKKKLQKSKTPKKKKNRSSKKLSNTPISKSSKEVNENNEDRDCDVEMVEAEVQIHTDSDDNVEHKDADNEAKPIPSVESANLLENEHIANDNLTEKDTSMEVTGDENNITVPEKDTSSLEITENENNIKVLNKATSSLEVTGNENNIKGLDKDKSSLEVTEDENDVTVSNNSTNCSQDKCTKSDINPMETENENEPVSDIEKSGDFSKKQLNITPKRRLTKKVKAEETNLNSSTSSSKLDESISSDPTTPRQNRSSSVTNSVGDESLNDSITGKTNLTPKQLQKKLESAKKREEREKEKQEREKKRQQEKEERAKQRQEKEELKKREKEEKEEAKRKEKEEKEEQKRKEREEKEKQKEMEKKLKEMKEEQKRKEKEDKEEQKKKEREAKEEEKRKKQEALELEKQEQELKKKKAAEAFVNFFVPKQKKERDQPIAPVSKNRMLSSFTIKADMRLAPTVRVDLSDEKREELDKALEGQDLSESCLYLKSLAKGDIKPITNGKTWPLDDKDDDDDVMIVEDELPPIDGAGEIITMEPTAREKLRPKLLSFHENRRPPYWGTWRKKSSFVKPRKPFAQDDKQLDYEVDSDEEWEEEQEGESLDGSVCGSDNEPDAGDDYEVDNEVFVPHGYLSDEEATMDEDDVLSLTPETQKARLKHLEDEFESEMKKPTEKLKPRMYGILWETSEGSKPENCVDALWNYFAKFAMIMNDPTPFLQPSNEAEELDKKKTKKKKIVTEGEEQSPKTEKKKRAKSENKESKKPKTDTKKTTPNQPGINSFLTKMKST